jgi:hypothetical protein
MNITEISYILINYVQILEILLTFYQTGKNFTLSIIECHWKLSSDLTIQ